jgi:hypothetical protein
MQTTYCDDMFLQYIIDAAVARQLIDKIYEKRKAAALELEKCVIYVTSYPLVLTVASC